MILMSHSILFSESKTLESVRTVTELFLVRAISNIYAIQFLLLHKIVNFSTKHHTKRVKYSTEHCY